MTRGVDIDEALDGLNEALAARGLAPAIPPVSTEIVAELEAEIAPMRLPGEVRRFWERVDVARLPLYPFPQFAGPDFALSSWRSTRDEFSELQPVALVLVGYTSQSCMSVELDVGNLAGGALFEWYIVDGGFERRFNRIGDWLRYVTRLVDDGSFLRKEGPQGQYLDVPPPEMYDHERATRPLPDPHPFYGATVDIGRDILEWPEHWQRAAGLRPEMLRPRGATHTIAELLASPPDQGVRATIAACVVAVAAGVGELRVRVDDGTAQLDVACPPNPLIGPRLRSWFEFDVIIEAGPRMVPPDPDDATRGIEDPVEELTAHLTAQYFAPPGATGDAIRRLPPPP